MTTLLKGRNRALKNSVGAKGINNRADVELIQDLLNQERNQPPVPYRATRLKVDGKCGPLTIEAIELFQTAVMKRGGPLVDGRVDPGYDTWKALNGNVKTSAEILPWITDWQTTQAIASAFGNAGARTTDATAGDYQKFSQLKYSGKVLGNRYGNDADKDGVLDSSTSIATAGCALTTLTMAATRIGSPVAPHWPAGLAPKDLTPIKANEICKSAGVFTRYMLNMAKAAEALGMVPDEYGFKWCPNPELPTNAADQIIAHLMTDRPVAAHVDYKRDDGGKGDHWVLLTNMQADNKVRAIDPSGGRFMTFTKSSTQSDRFKSTKKGVLFGEAGQGFGPKTTKNQPNYCVVRYILLKEVAGTSAAL